MVSLEELKRRREKEFKSLGIVGIKSIKRSEKQKVKQDIRKIKAAKFRAQLGISKESVEKAGNIFKGSGKGILKVTKVIGKGLFALGQSSNEYYAREQKKKRR